MSYHQLRTHCSVRIALKRSKDKLKKAKQEYKYIKWHWSYSQRKADLWLMPTLQVGCKPSFVVSALKFIVVTLYLLLFWSVICYKACNTSELGSGSIAKHCAWSCDVLSAIQLLVFESVLYGVNKEACSARLISKICTWCECFQFLKLLLQAFSLL